MADHEAPVRAEPPLSRVPDWLTRAGTAAWLTLGIIVLAVVAYIGLARLSALLIPLVIAVVMAMIFHSVVDRLARVRVPRSIAAALVLVVIVALAAGAIWLSVRGVIDQGDDIAAQVQLGWAQVQQWLANQGIGVENLRNAWESLSGSLGSAGGGGATSLVQAGLSGLGAFLLGLFVGTFLLYYLLKDWQVVRDWLAGHLGLPNDLGAGLVEDATEAIRQYFAGLAITSIPISILIGATMWLLDLPLAFTVGLVTFVTSFVPYLGAIVSGAFAVLVALGSGGVTDAIIVLVVVLLTQNVLQVVVLTKITSDRLALHPIVNLASTIVGATLAGLVGATLSAPIVAMLLTARARAVAYYRSDPGGAAVTPPVPDTRQ